MAAFSFGPVKDSTTTYASGNAVPNRSWKVLLDGKVIGEIDVHMHIRRGPDGQIDTSFGFTPVVYGPAPGGS